MHVAKSDLIVELHIPDFEKAKDFYGKLGFNTVWERQPEEMKGYLVMKRGEAIICFWSGNDEVYNQEYFSQFPKDTKRGYGVELVIMIEDIESYFQTVKKFANVVEELAVKPWGTKDFRIEDPFGFYLRFSEPYNTLEDINAVA